MPPILIKVVAFAVAAGALVGAYFTSGNQVVSTALFGVATYCIGLAQKEVGRLEDSV
jgi:hypothetical protein